MAAYSGHDGRVKLFVGTSNGLVSFLSCTNDGTEIKSLGTIKLPERPVINAVVAMNSSPNQEVALIAHSLGLHTATAYSSTR